MAVYFIKLLKANWWSFCLFHFQISLWNFELFRMREKQIPVDQVEVKETITAFAWEPTGSRFCCLHGESPRISASFYKIHEKGKVELVSKSKNILRFFIFYFMVSAVLEWWKHPRGKRVISRLGKALSNYSNTTLLKKIKGTWSAPSLVCGHSQVQLLEDMHNCTSLKSLMFKKQLTLLAMSLTQPWHLFKG